MTKEKKIRAEIDDEWRRLIIQLQLDYRQPTQPHVKMFMMIKDERERLQAAHCAALHQLYYHMQMRRSGVKEFQEA